MYPLYSAGNLLPGNSTFSPLLIVGAPRTGSSFLVEALCEAGGYSGSAEGHLFPLMAELDAVVRGYYGQAEALGLLTISENTITKVAEATVRKGLVELFERFNGELFPDTRRVLDKTVNVEAIGALPYLLGVWPSAKVLYLKRDGVENVESAEKYFGVDLSTACRNWSHCGEEWERIKPLLPDESYVVIDHATLTDSPAETCAQVARLLDFDEATAESLTKFVTLRAGAWRRTHPKREALARLGWDTTRLATFLAICGRQMVRQGYASEEEVRAASTTCDTVLVPLRHEAARILSIDDERYFVPSGDGWFVVPGRESATTIVFERIDITDTAQLVGELMLTHPAAHPVRAEFIGMTAGEGKIVLSGSVQLDALKPVQLSLPLRSRAKQIYCLIRVLLAKGSSTNDHAWVRMDRMAFVQ